MPLHLLVIAGSMVAIAARWPSPWLAPVLSLSVGASFAGLVFLGHELLHGAVVRGKRARYLTGWVAFLPFVVSPRLWVAWHNRVHHGNAQRSGVDPDAYPTLAEYRGSSSVRAATDWFGIGRRRLRGLSALLVGFSIQSLHILVVAGRRGYLSAREQRRAVLETLLALTVWGALFAWLGPIGFLFACVLPLLVANAVVMAHIFTNHSLSPLTPVNDPLANSLSVTLPRFFTWLTLGFGFHVEHHMLPWMSMRHGREVRALLVARWPERYQSMSLWQALLRVHQTPRVYAEPTVLFDPQSGQRVPTLGPATTEVAKVPEPPSDLPRLWPSAGSGLHGCGVARDGVAYGDGQGTGVDAARVLGAGGR
jgi:fatty acid desaturase